MRWTLLVVTACLVAAPCWVSADVQDFAKHKDIRYGQYDPATGRMMPVDQGLRGDPPMWKAEFWESQHPGTGYLTTGYAYSAGGFIQPGFVFAMDWGDLVDADDPARMVGSFDTGWTTNHTLDPTGATGLFMLLGWYQSYDGITAVQNFPDGYYEPDWITGFSWATLPGVAGGPASGERAGWILPSGDLTNGGDPNVDPNAPYDWSFSLDGDDIDLDGNADFGYAYYFIDTLDATEAGWWIGDDPNGDVGTTNDYFDYELIQDPNLDPNDPNAFYFVLSAWWWFGGTPYAQAFLRMWAVPFDEYACPAECSTSLDHDCDVDMADLVILKAALGTCEGDPGYLPEADFDDSGCIDAADLAKMTAQFGNVCACPADCTTSLDEDCDVDFDDLNILLAAYNACPGDPDYNPDADFTDPVCVDFDDLNLLLSQYNNNCRP